MRLSATSAALSPAGRRDPHATCPLTYTVKDCGPQGGPGWGGRCCSNSRAQSRGTGPLTATLAATTTSRGRSLSLSTAAFEMSLHLQDPSPAGAQPRGAEGVALNRGAAHRAGAGHLSPLWGGRHEGLQPGLAPGTALGPSGREGAGRPLPAARCSACIYSLVIVVRTLPARPPSPQNSECTARKSLRGRATRQLSGAQPGCETETLYPLTGSSRAPPPSPPAPATLVSRLLTVHDFRSHV